MLFSQNTENKMLFAFLFFLDESSMVSWLKVSIDLCLLSFIWHFQLYLASDYTIIHCLKMLSINIVFLQEQISPQLYYTCKTFSATVTDVMVKNGGRVGLGADFWTWYCAGGKDPSCLKQLLSRMLVILVREREGTCTRSAWPVCRGKRLKLRQLLEKFQFHPSCVLEIVNIKLSGCTVL